MHAENDCRNAALMTIITQLPQAKIGNFNVTLLNINFTTNTFLSKIKLKCLFVLENLP